MTEQLNMLGVDERFATYQQRHCCSPCWCARCAVCKQPLTKHAFTEIDAQIEAAHALDVPGHFQHRCPGS